MLFSLHTFIYVVYLPTVYLLFIIMTYFFLLIQVFIRLLLNNKRTYFPHLCNLKKKQTTVFLLKKPKTSYNHFFSIFTLKNTVSVTVHRHLWTNNQMWICGRKQNVTTPEEPMMTILPSLERSPSPTSSCSMKAREPIRYGSGLST